ncbi:LPXTG cell wall anchor domain-containing protein [Nakamurella silvestris]|nr:LPXTG cell wall anchor domain-containing protein [Nakamurella silvestris]
MILYGVSTSVSAPSASAASGTVAGTVFEDFNANGVKDTGTNTPGTASATDVGVQGVNVTVTDSNGVTVGTGTTSAAGTYSIAVSAAATTAVRVEITPPTGYTDGPQGADSGSGIQFVTLGTAGAGAVNAGLTRLGNYSKATPKIVAIQQWAPIGNNLALGGGALLDLSTRATVISTDWSTRGIATGTTEALATQTGTVWGSAQLDDSYAFSSAYFKRHAKTGITGQTPSQRMGSIYLTTLGGAADATPWVTIPNAGTDPRPNQDTMTATNWFHDVGALENIGKIALGGMAMALDHKSVYVVNLNDKNLYQVPFTRGAGGVPVAGTPVAITMPIALPGAAVSCLPANTRPFGVTAQNNALWVTLTCAGPAASDLRGYIYRYDLTAGTFGAAPAFEMALTGYTRGSVYGAPQNAAWNAWTDSWMVTNTGTNVAAIYPQPILSDVAFDSNGDMSIGIKDRFGDQVGYEAGSPNTADGSTFEGFAGGDTLRACRNADQSAWVLESNASCGYPGAVRTGYGAGNGQGPGGGEFYSDDYTNTHQQVLLGGLLQIPGFGQLVSTAFDPGNAVRSQGYRYLSNLNGSYSTSDGYRTLIDVVNSSSSTSSPTQGSFAKGGGLGDLTALVGQAPLEIGNRVWLDADRDGIQDAGENAIAGVTVQLLSADGNTVVATKVTDANGNYLFTSAADGLQPETDYIVRVAASNFAAGGALEHYLISPTGVGDDREVDSNGVAVGGAVQATVKTGLENQNNHSIDFGFYTPVYAVGDYVWWDKDRNGRQDAGEPAIEGVTVTLTGAGAPRTTTTDSAGHYIFDGLEPGTYTVTFTPPAGFAATTTNASGTTVANDSNGLSSQVTVGPIGAGLPQMRLPVAGDGAPLAAAVDPTIDAGFVQIVYAVGDYVWYDANVNGIQDPLESPVVGATVTLLKADGTPATNADGVVVAATTTNNVGHYVFDNLLPGAYKVKFSDLPAGFTFTQQNVAGAAAGLNSNPDQTGVTPTFTLGPVGAGLPQMANVVAADGTTLATAIDRTIDAGIYRPDVLAVGDYVWYDDNFNGIQDAGEAPVAGVTVTLLTAAGDRAQHLFGGDVADVVTDANGHYVFDNLPAGSYRVQFSTIPAGFTFTKSSAAGSTAANDSNPAGTGLTPVFTLAAGGTNMRVPNPAIDGVIVADQINPTIDAGLTTVFAVGDYVWFDVNKNGIQDEGEKPVPGVTVKLQNADGTPALNAAGTAVAATTTDDAGHYVFDNLAPGTYRVAFSGLPTGYEFTTPAAGAVGVDSNPASTGITPTFTLNRTSPTVRTVVEADGTTLAVYIDPTIDAGIHLSKAYAIGDVVFYDDNRDGLQSAGEAGVPGITVTLLDEDGEPAVDLVGDPVPPVTTGPDGKYVFDNLAPGSYQVQFSGLPPRYSFTEAGVGEDPAVDSNADATGRTAVVTIGEGAPGTRAVVEADGQLAAVGINPTIDAGIITAFAVGDYVWYDVDHDGLQGEDEDPVVGITVELVDVDGAPVKDINGVTVASTVTDAQGHYVFDKLPAGEYRIRFSGIPTGYEFTTPGLGGLDSNPDTTGLTPAFTLGRTAPDMRAVVTADGVAVASLINPTIDAGIVLSPAYAVGDYVWFDNNGNGKQDEGEPGVPGVTVTLLNPDGTPARDALGNLVPPTVTDENGHYVFDNLAPGDYKIDFSNTPTGHAYVTPKAEGTEGDNDSDADNAGHTPVFTVGPDSTDNRPVTDDDGDLIAVGINPTIDAGIVPRLAIGDFVWFDTNKNGVQDAGETGLAGATVTLLDGNGQPAKDFDGELVPAATTDENGHYVFDNLYPGSYQVVFSGLPTGYIFTGQSVEGSSAAEDSNPGVSGATPVFSLIGGGTNVRPVTEADSALGVDKAVAIDPTIDAGIFPAPQYSIGDHTFYDNNGNGIQDAGDTPLAGVTVTLLDAAGNPARNAFGELVPPVVTDAQGNYLFDGLAPGEYIVTFGNIPAGYEFSPQYADGSTPATDSNVPASGRSDVINIGPSDPNMVPVVPGPGSHTVGLNPTVDAGVVPRLAVGDYVWFDKNKNGVQDSGEKPFAGAIVTLLDAAGNPAKDFDGVLVAPTKTDAKGYYVFDNLYPGDYQVAFSGLPTGYIFTGQSTLVSTPATDSNPAATGVTPVFALVGNGANVRPVTAADRNKGVARAIGIDPTIDAGIIPAPAYAIGDYVWFDKNQNGRQDKGEKPVVGLSVTLLDADGKPAVDSFGVPVPATVTDAKGHYVFDNLAPGSYRVQFGTPPTGYSFTTANSGSDDKDSDADDTGLTPIVEVGPASSATRTPVAADGTTIAVGINPTVDAGLVPTPTYAVGDYVWIDNNGNGVQDAGDIPVAGVLVSLFDADGKPAVDSYGNPVAPVRTDAKGHYVFDSLAAGTYFVTVTETPAGYVFTQQFAGSSKAKDSNVNKAGVANTFTLGINEPNIRPVKSTDGDLVASWIDPTIDAGLVPLLALGDYVWFDSNHNGIQDAGEKPVQGVTVTLFDEDGNVVATTVTDAKGHYVFDGLLPGKYRVQFTDLPAGYTFTGKNAAGSDFTNDSDAGSGGYSSYVILVGGAAGHVRAVADGDGVTQALWIDPTVDAGLIQSDVATLPNTGVAAMNQLMAALALLLAGAGLVVVGRRRRVSQG